MNAQQHIDLSEKLLNQTEAVITKRVESGEKGATMEALLAALTHAVIGVAKRTGTGRV